MHPIIDPADVQRYRDLLVISEQVNSEIDGLKAKWRNLGVGRFGPVSVQQSRRFAAEACVQWCETNAPQLLDAIREPVISAARAKNVLPPAIYATFMLPAGEPRVTVAR